MSPERAREIYDDWDEEKWTLGPHTRIVGAILAAVAEAEREAYTRAAITCDNLGCAECATAIEEMRDK